MEPEPSEEKKPAEDNTEEDGATHISMLLKTVPVLDELFEIHHKVGKGSFSSVFLATLKNSQCSRKYAVKHLIPTCHPNRIERELQCLKDIGGKDHVVGLELCLRNAGSVVFIMPFMAHHNFADYVCDMGANELRDYMKALLTAIRRVHSFNIIHRDIKPSNFLYDRKNRRYLLVDFGLAQQYNANKPDNTNAKSATSITQSGKRKRPDENKIDTTLKNVNKISMDKCYCFAKPKICSLCSVRPVQNAPRAGTPGFRPPEVLLKYASQTPAIDIWACGVMMLCILSGSHPFFRGPDDVTALAEITAVFGSNAMQLCAKKLGKKLIFSPYIGGTDITILCQKLQERNKSSKNISSESLKEENKPKYPEEAYQLLKKLLDLDYKTRITAEQALLHPFFNL